MSGRRWRLNSSRWIVPFVLVAVGLVWIGQGLGVLRGSSFMVDDLRWSLAGLALVSVGAVVGWRRRR
jgi:MYXO-CTERM domain-containing protein